MLMFIAAEVNLIGIIILALILSKLNRNDKQTATTAFRRTAAAVLVIMVVDTSWLLVDGHPSPTLIVVNYAVNVLYQILSCLIAYLWVWYVRCKLNREVSASRRHAVLLALPLALESLLCLSSPWTHWTFLITDQNVYQRGPLALLRFVLVCVYFVGASVRALVYARKETDREKRAGAISLALFVVLPLAGGFASIYSAYLPTIWPLSAVSLLMVYLNLLNRQISTDSLTGLNNRRQFDDFLRAQMEGQRREGMLSLMLIDIDDFKQINDTYGHAVGDDALYNAASIMKRVCGKGNAFLARYGGDEFAIVFEAMRSDDAAKLRDELECAFVEFNKQRPGRYVLKFSLGAATLLPGMSAPLELIRLADARLYEDKARRKQQNAAARMREPGPGRGGTRG